jgi:hypothetical protein
VRPGLSLRHGRQRVGRQSRQRRPVSPSGGRRASLGSGGGGGSGGRRQRQRRCVVKPAAAEAAARTGGSGSRTETVRSRSRIATAPSTTVTGGSWCGRWRDRRTRSSLRRVRGCLRVLVAGAAGGGVRPSCVAAMGTKSPVRPVSERDRAGTGERLRNDNGGGLRLYTCVRGVPVDDPEAKRRR